MPITIEIPSALQKFVDNQDEVEVSGNTVGSAFDNLCTQYPKLKEQLYDEAGAIRNFINVYLNDDDIRYAQNLETAVDDEDCIQLIPSIAGGI